MATYTGPAYASGATRGWTIAEGVILVILGIIAIAAPFFTTAITALILPAVLFVKGIAEIVSAFTRHAGGSRWWTLALGIISILAAAFLFARPLLVLVSLPILLTVYLVADGLVRIAGAFTAAVGRGWVLLTGVLSLVLAGLLWVGGIADAVLFTGVLIGINVLSAGIMLLALGASRDASSVAY